MTKKLLFTIVFLGNTLLFGQTGILKGMLTDSKTGEGIPFANIRVEKNGTVISKTVTDLDGKYCIGSLTCGKYNIKAVSLGYEAMEIKSVNIAENQTSYYDLKAKETAVTITCCEIIEYVKPLVEPTSCFGSSITCTHCCFGGWCCFGDVRYDSIVSPVEKKSMDAVQVSFLVYPNPFTEYAVIKIISEDTFAYKNVKLFDLSGKEVRNIEFTGSEQILERGTLSPGIYLYMVSSDNKTLATGKLEVIQ